MQGPAHLVTVLVVVHAGQRAVGVAVNVRVHATGVAVTSPAHVALCAHTHTHTRKQVKSILVDQQIYHLVVTAAT